MRYLRTAMTGLIVAGLAACSSGGGGTNGSLDLSVTDAPVDDAASVVVQFNSVAFKTQGGAEEIIRNVMASSRQLDLLEYQGGRAALLLDNVTLPAGKYEWVRLVIDDEPGVRDSYLTLSTGEECELEVPSGAESGLKLNRGFTLPADGSIALTIDFDLAKSVQAPPGKVGVAESCTQGYLLRPTLRIVDDANVGAIAGTVASSLVTDSCMPKVYIFSGTAVTPDDLEETAAGTDVDPTVVANATIQNGATDYSYHAAFLPPGPYTVAFTCGDDDPTANDTLTFQSAQDVTVTQNTLTTVNFAPAAP